VDREGRALKPTELGFVVNDLLVEHFPTFIDPGFTAGMENDLDDVAAGEREWQPVVKDFYRPLESAIATAIEQAPKQVEEINENCPDPLGIHTEPAPLIIRWGRRGKFIGCSAFPQCTYTRGLDGEENEAPQESDEKCPECEAPMLIRTGRFGKFLACSRYPECKGRKPFNQPLGVKCPNTGGDIVERRTKRGRTFYGCTDYPNCDFTTWSRPFSTPCPNCAGIIVADKDNMAKCVKCDWKGEAPQTPEREPATV
jgi:DNA topoisomerase-1